MKFCFIPDDINTADTHFKATEKAVESIKLGKQHIFVIENHGDMLVVHDSEANIDEEVTLKSTSINHGWKPTF